LEQEFLTAGLGLIILLLAGDTLVKGAVNLSLRAGVPALVVSLTVVSFGTSAPELLVSVKAVIDGATGIALGNVVGSNTANILLVLGIPALIAPIRSGVCNTQKSYLIMLASTVLFIALCLWGTLRWPQGVILLVVLAGILLETFFSARNARRACAAEEACVERIDEVEGADPHLSYQRIGIYLLLGLVGLPLGADLLVNSAVNIAHEFHISEAVIGLTLIAVGTSLPELATTVMAAIRHHTEVALGNVIGSNMFNLLGIMGVTALVGPVRIPSEIIQFDIWVMLGASLLLVPFVFFRWNIGRLWGGALTVLYAAYMLAVVN